MRGKKLILKQLDTGCIIPVSHKLNHDGYFRYTIRNPNGKGRGKLIMYHRYIWEQKYGKIPEGDEIDHICRNRACCNIEHLQMLEGHDHAVKGNKTRYKERKEKAKAHWLQTKCSGIALASLFEVCPDTACKWIREWRV